MRMLTLANGLRSRGAAVEFACSSGEGNLNALIRKQGFGLIEAVSIGGAAYDAMIVDHYGLNRAWESQARRFARSIVIIDDLADRPHDADLLIDQNLHDSPKTRYQELVPSECRVLVGPEFALLRPEFHAARGRVKLPRSKIEQILVSYGGTDPSGQTLVALEALKDCRALGVQEVQVIAGSLNSKKVEIERRCHDAGFVYHETVSTMAEFMLSSDLAIGAGGVTTLERCALGLPALVTIIADNQVEVSWRGHKEGFQICLGEQQTVTPERIRAELKKLVQDPSRLEALSRCAYKTVDGKGTERVVEEILSLSKKDVSKS